jgi:uracil-DNA glycosylase
MDTQLLPAPIFFLEPSWQKALENELAKPYLAELKAFVAKERYSGCEVYPPEELVFNALQVTPFSSVKVVIVGQDPYHGFGQAHGLSFSVNHGIATPPSLQNIYKEMQSDLGLAIPNHGCLINWAKQGVLLLNATLTVRKSEPLSHHGRGWEQFTDAILAAVAEKKESCVFLLWGKNAQDKCRTIDIDAQKHLVLTAVHPSPFSAARGFFGCRHFSQVNSFLKQRGKEPISWNLE